MEKLEAAIARARDQRSGMVGNVSSELERVTAEQPDIADHSRERGAPASAVTVDRTEIPVSEIQYTITRVVELDPELLELNRVIAGQRDDSRVEAYRQLRTQVLQLFEQNEWSTLAITSPRESAGKTLTAVNLAISLSHEVTHTVLLVDLDLKKPSVSSTLGVSVDAGIVEVVQGEAHMEQVLYNPSVPRLVVLPARATHHSASELLTTPAMRAVVEELRTRYSTRIVIFDLPPLLRNDDALKFSPVADATLLVVEEGVNTKDDIEQATHLLRNANLVGTLLNKAT